MSKLIEKILCSRKQMNNVRYTVKTCSGAPARVSSMTSSTISTCGWNTNTMTRSTTSRYATEQQSWNTTQKPKHGACCICHLHDCLSFSPRFVHESYPRNDEKKMLLELFCLWTLLQGHGIHNGYHSILQSERMKTKLDTQTTHHHIVHVMHVDPTYLRSRV